MKHMKLVVLAGAGLLAASVSGWAVAGAHQSAEYRLPTGSTVELTQTLRFPAGSARTYIQDGKPQGWNDLNLWEPYCSFGLNSTRDHQPLVREIHPTTFTTGNTRLGVYAALNLADPPVADPNSVFARQGVEVADDHGAGFPSQFSFTTTITLFSDQEPQVADLTCAYYGMHGAPEDRNLTLTQIQDTLGAVAKLHQG